METPSQPQANIANAQKRPNAINPSPAWIVPNSDIVELKQRNPRLDPLIPCPGHPRLASPRGLPEFVSWPGLLLERTECQGPKRAQNPLAAPFRDATGTQGNTGIERQRQCRTPGLMRSERPHESRTCRLRKSLSS